MAKRTNAKTIKMYEKNPVLAFARLAFSIILVLVLVFLVVFFVKAIITGFPAQCQGANKTG